MSATKRTLQNVITVGSCDVYVKEHTSSSLPDISAICIDDYKFGHTKNGATIKYEKEVTELSDDFGRIKKTIINSEKVTMQFGLFGWNGRTIEKLVSTASATESGGKRVTEIGGIQNDDGKVYVVCLHHIDAQDGDAWYLGVGKNTEGLELAYKQDDGTVLEPTFTCEPYDGAGRLLKYIEELGSDSGAANAG